MKDYEKLSFKSISVKLLKIDTFFKQGKRRTDPNDFSYKYVTSI